ncbi:MAG: deoxyribonuclease IV [Patescibacteria group bacterium]
MMKNVSQREIRAREIGVAREVVRKIGAHLSTNGGIDKAVERAAAIGANCLQVFSGSPRMWLRTSLERIDAQKIWSKQRELSVTPIFTHALYLLNLASDNPDLVKKSLESLKHDLRFDSHIKGSGVVVHLGSHQGRGWAAVKEQLAASILEILSQTPANSRFLIENSAGQNGKIASDLTEIRWLLDEVRRELPANSHDRLGWCFDTCHGFAAGYSYLEDSGQRQISPEIGRLKLWSDLACVHVNDSRDAFDSGRDRHENIGEGNLPLTDLGNFLRLPELATVPFITEAPGFDGNGPDAENIARIRQLVEEEK